VGATIWRVAAVAGRLGVDLPPHAVVVSAAETTTAGTTIFISTLRPVMGKLLLQGRSTTTPATTPSATVLSFSGVEHTPT